MVPVVATFLIASRDQPSHLASAMQFLKATRRPPPPADPMTAAAALAQMLVVPQVFFVSTCKGCMPPASEIHLSPVASRNREELLALRSTWPINAVVDPNASTATVQTKSFASEHTVCIGVWSRGTDAGPCNATLGGTGGVATLASADTDPARMVQR